jgi:hypothetical protein
MNGKISAQELRSIVVRHDGQDQCGNCGVWYTQGAYPDEQIGCCRDCRPLGRIRYDA